MNKREIKQQIRNIAKSINIEDIINNKSIEIIFEKIDELEDVSNEFGIELDLSYEELKQQVVMSVLEENECFNDLKTDIEEIISETEEYMEDLSESKAEAIEEELLSPLQEVLEKLEDTSFIECEEDVENLINEVIEELINL